jgi:hypothetical protein
MAPKSPHWNPAHEKEINEMLDRILDHREAAERRRVAKIVAQRSGSSARPAGSTPPVPSARKVH